MDKKPMTARDKLELLKEIERRNEQRRVEFAKKAREEKLLDLYLNGHLSKEQFYKYLEK